MPKQVRQTPSEEQEQPEPETEEEEEEAKPEASADEQDDLKSYSKKVRKRIEREVRLKNKARAEADQLRQQLDAARAEKEAIASTEQIDATLKEKRAKLKAIREEFDPEKVDDEINLLTEITDLQAQKRHLAGYGAQQQQRTVAVAPNPHLAKWLERNQTWFDKPEYGAQSAAARQVDQALIAEGYAPTDPKYFEELDRRLSSKVRLPTQTRSRASVSPVAPVTDTPPRSRTKVVLTKGDLAFMEKMGMDSKNPAHLKAFAAERRTSQRTS